MTSRVMTTNAPSLVRYRMPCSPLSFHLARVLWHRPHIPHHAISPFTRPASRPFTCTASDETPGPGRRGMRSTTDLVRFRRSRFAAHLTELALRGAPGAPRPDPPTPMQAALASVGATHEQRVLARLVRLVQLQYKEQHTDQPRHFPGPDPSSGPHIHPDPLTSIPLCLSISRNSPNPHAATASALRMGVPIIHQPYLSDGALLHGYADILLRNSHNPFLAPDFTQPPDAYSVIEVKFASTVRQDYVLQAAAYTDLLRRLCHQLGLPPPCAPFIWLGPASTAPSGTDIHAVDDFFQSMKKSYLQFLTTFCLAAPLPKIDAPLSDLTPWTSYAKLHIEQTDSLLQIAGIRRSQVHHLESAGIMTMRDFSNVEITSVPSVLQHMGLAPLQKLMDQARLQVATKDKLADCRASLMQATHSTGNSIAPLFEIIPPKAQAQFGLHRLPGPSTLDIYFDMEGYPLMQDGLEYLLGALAVPLEGQGRFRTWWAHDRVEEEEAFVAFVTWLWNKRSCDGPLQSSSSTEEDGVNADIPLRVYHYGHYEVSALRRLAARAVTGHGLEASMRLDNMLSEGVFVDVYRIIKSGIRLGEPSYSLKNVERLVGVSRLGDELRDAESSVAKYFEWRRSNNEQFHDDSNDSVVSCVTSDDDTGVQGGDELLLEIERYNRQDCESLQQVVVWLRNLCLAKDIEYVRWCPSSPAAFKQPRSSTGLDDVTENDD